VRGSATPIALATAPSPPTILLVGGDAATRSMLRFLCESEGYAVREVAALWGNEAEVGPITVARSEASNGDDPVLYIVLADRRGEPAMLAHLARLRAQRAARVLLVMHGADPALRRSALAHGADEVVPLPIAPGDLLKRLRALVGEYSNHPSATPMSTSQHLVRAGGLTLHMQDRVLGDETGWAVRLTAQETALLASLMHTPGRLVTRGELAAGLWGADAAWSANALVVLVRRLRARLRHMGNGERLPTADALAAQEAPGEGYIRTVRGWGYLFEARARPRVGDTTVPDGRPRVLVVDDDRATRAMIGEVLQRAGYTVMSALGAQAPALARATPPALILLDVNMPGMDGIQVRRALRATPRTAAIPVIALSASTTLRLHSAALVADDYLPKPFDIDELLLRVERWAGAPLPR
jgi:DNA-binding response OmpR family regulator